MCLYISGALLWAVTLLAIMAAGAWVMRVKPTRGEVAGAIAMSVLHGAFWPVSLATTLVVQIGDYLEDVRRDRG